MHLRRGCRAPWFSRLSGLIGSLTSCHFAPDGDPRFDAGDLRDKSDPVILGSALVQGRRPRMKDRFANVLRAGVVVSLEADAIGHEITGQAYRGTCS